MAEKIIKPEELDRDWREGEKEDKRELAKTEKEKVLGFLWEKGIREYFDLRNEKGQKLGVEIEYTTKTKEGIQKEIERRNNNGEIVNTSVIELDADGNFKSLEKSCLSHNLEKILLRKVTKLGNWFEVEIYNSGDISRGRARVEKKDNLLRESITYEKDGEKSYAAEYEYNAEGKQTKYTYKSWDKERNEWGNYKVTLSKYDNSGILTETDEPYRYSGGGRTITKYNDKKLAVEERHQSGDGKLMWKTLNSYTEDGKLLKSETTDNGIKTIVENRYNEKGQEIRSTETTNYNKETQKIENWMRDKREVRRNYDKKGICTGWTEDDYDAKERREYVYEKNSSKSTLKEKYPLNS